MGYYASASGSAKIKDEKSCKKLKQLIENETKKCGYNPWLDYDIDEKNLFIDIYDSEKYHEDDTMAFLNVITPFVEEGSLEYTGEDDCHWRFILRDGKWMEENGTVDYDFESYTDEELIEELKKRGYQVTKAA